MGPRLRGDDEECVAGFAVYSQRYCLRSEEHTSELQSQSNLVCRLLLVKKKLLHPPVGFLALDVGEHGKIEGWRRRRRCPLEGASIPRIADLVAKFLTPANADDELRDLQDYPDRMIAAPPAAISNHGCQAATS